MYYARPYLRTEHNIITIIHTQYNITYYTAAAYGKQVQRVIKTTRVYVMNIILYIIYECTTRTCCMHKTLVDKIVDRRTYTPPPYNINAHTYIIITYIYILHGSACVLLYSGAAASIRFVTSFHCASEKKNIKYLI